MRKILLVVLLVGLTFVLNGCVTIKSNTVQAEGNEVKVYHTSTMNDIDVVSNMSPDAKVEGYKAIAARPFLTQAERAYLVEAVKNSSLDQKQKDDVLLVLLRNQTVGSGGTSGKKTE
jgi:uncharacterized protein YceK